MTNKQAKKTAELVKVIKAMKVLLQYGHIYLPFNVINELRLNLETRKRDLRYLLDGQDCT